MPEAKRKEKLRGRDSPDGQEASVRTEYVWRDRIVSCKPGSQTRMHFISLLFNLYTESIIQKTELDSEEERVKVGGRNTTNNLCR